MSRKPGGPGWFKDLLDPTRHKLSRNVVEWEHAVTSRPFVSTRYCLMSCRSPLFVRTRAGRLFCSSWSQVRGSACLLAHRTFGLEEVQRQADHERCRGLRFN